MCVCFRRCFDIHVHVIVYTQYGRFSDILLYSDTCVYCVGKSNRCAFDEPRANSHRKYTLEAKNESSFFLHEFLFNFVFRLSSLWCSIRTNIPFLLNSWDLVQKHGRFWSRKHVRSIRSWIRWFGCGGKFSVLFRCHSKCSVKLQHSFVESLFEYSLIVFFVSIVQLQKAYARGDLKPGLNIEVGNGVQRKAINNIVSKMQLHVLEISIRLFIFIFLLLFFRARSWAYKRNWTNSNWICRGLNVWT